MEELEDLILKLNTDQYQAVSVYNIKSGEYIYKNVTHDKILSEFGSGEDFFEKINADGYTRLMIHPKRKNGKNAFKIDGVPFEINIESEVQKPAKLNFTPVTKKKKKNKKSSSRGIFGLGAVDIMDLKFDSKEKTRFEADNVHLKSKNEQLEKEIAELKEEKLKKQYAKETNDGLYGLVKEGLQTLPIVLKSLNVSVAPIPFAGMAATENNFENLSEVKQNFIKAIENEDEDMVMLLDVIHQNINSSESENDFAKDLQNLLFTHEIIKE